MIRNGIKPLWMIIWLGLVAGVALAASEKLTCIETSGMVINRDVPPHVCRCDGMQLKLYDQRAADGDAKFLCLGIPK